MYLEHWSLARPPFEAEPDSRFLFTTPRREQAQAALFYAARDGGEPVLIAGPPGCGKTLLLRALRRALPREQYLVAFVPEADCARIGLLRRLATALNRTMAPDSAAAMDAVQQHVVHCAQSGQGVVVLLDDWPADADAALLGELRWLLNLDLGRARAAVVMSTDDAEAAARWPAWLKQRLFATVYVEPLLPDEVPAYLEHRMRVARQEPAAGSEQATVFMPEAAAAIASWSQGVPRLVNRAAHLALHAAYLDGAKRVDADAVACALDRVVSMPLSGVGA